MSIGLSPIGQNAVAASPSSGAPPSLNTLAVTDAPDIVAIAGAGALPPRLYYIVYPTATGTDPTDDATGKAHIKAGEDGAGVTATASGNELSPVAEIDPFDYAQAAGLSPSTEYKIAYLWSIGGADSNVAVSGPFTTATGGSAHLIVGVGSSQGNAASPATIAQTHQVAAAGSQSANVAGAGTIRQTHPIVGAGSSQSTVASAAAVRQTHLVTAANSAQANTASAGSILTATLIIGADSAQPNTSSTAAINQTHRVAAAGSQQGNACSGGAIRQTHLVRGATCRTTPIASGGSVSQTTTTFVIGASSSQPNACSGGSVRQTHLARGANSTQPNVGAAGVVIQTHRVRGANSQLGNACSTSAVRQTHLLSGSASNQPNAASSAIVISGTGTVGATPSEVAAAVFARAIEAGYNFEEVIRIIAAAAAGKTQKSAPDAGGNRTLTITGIDGVTPRIVGTIDAENNRTGATYDGS